MNSFGIMMGLRDQAVDFLISQLIEWHLDLFIDN